MTVLPTEEPGSGDQAREIGKELADEYTPAGFRLVIDQYPDKFRAQIKAGYLAAHRDRDGPKTKGEP